MAAFSSSVCATVTLLMCVLGSHALDLLRAAATSGKPSVPAVHCRCAVYPNVTLCTWPQPPQPSPTHYVASYSERDVRGSTVQLQVIPPGASPSALTSAPVSSSEQLWHCQLPNLKLLTNYIINITAVHPSGSSSYLSSSMLEDIVKPDPPVDVRISPRNIRNLLVEWTPPPTWADLDIFPLKYHILYQWESRGIPKFVNLGPVENTKIELKGLTPGRPYLFQVCATELLGLGQCSDWSSPVNITIPKTNL
ncbi:interleukin-27 subunit beta [Salarias fasciatus]|uniref:Fibronectin type-III domain-containing protein n=1 Tax=Salarias fasciatus TaxID=181472 RepID=A0A672IZX5_SALFA|nr:interleukin-27 subunit beta [Salarias fasciatus]